LVVCGSEELDITKRLQHWCSMVKDHFYQLSTPQDPRTVS
jgi:hypothetical protein